VSFDPELARSIDRVDSEARPPVLFKADAMHLAMVAMTHSELIANL
jgi:hypothetical protein